MIPIGDIRVPTALFVGIEDTLADVEDARWIEATMGDTIIAFELNPGGHMSFMYGKDMSYWSKVMAIFNEYQPV